MTATPALFRCEGGAYVPTEASGSPWRRDALHGGPPSGLLAHLACSELGETDLRPARLTVDLFRSVPHAPLAGRARVLRRGRRLALVESVLEAEGVAVCRATVLFLLASASPSYSVGEADAETGLALPDELTVGSLAPPELRDRMLPGFHRHVEACWVRQDARPAVWLRMPMALIEGRPSEPFERLAALSDFGNMLAGRSRYAAGERGPGYINTDLTVYIARPPQGEWIGMALERVVEAAGTGQVEVGQYDANGAFGRLLQARLANSTQAALLSTE